MTIQAWFSIYKDSEPLEEMAVYRALYGEGSLWVIKSPVRDLMTV